MARFLELENGIFININEIRSIGRLGKDNNRPVVDKSGNLAGYWCKEPYQLEEDVIPAFGVTAYVIWWWGDGRPDRSHIYFERQHVIGWKYSGYGDHGYYPILVEEPSGGAIILVEQPDGRLVEPEMRCFESIAEAQEKLLLEWQQAYDEQEAKKEKV